MARALITLTKDRNLETRQYNLMGIDLGEGVRRRALVVSLVFLVIWIVLILAVLQVPLRPKLALLYVAPPLLLAGKGLQADESERRQVIDGWMWAARYFVTDRWMALVALSPARSEKPFAMAITTRMKDPERATAPTKAPMILASSTWTGAPGPAPRSGPLRAAGVPAPRVAAPRVGAPAQGGPRHSTASEKGR